MQYLSNINEPKDIKNLSYNELDVLAQEIRQAILNRTSVLGGHVGSNLGMVEAIIALHYVFDSPKDKIVFDVSHQCYAHKTLTGRKEYFLHNELMRNISGYTNPKESKHDLFTIGHTSTSVSLACGLAKARDIQNQTHNVIAVIGDGSLSGGEALEGLDFAGELDTNLIIVVNDNERSIAENHGGMYKNLQLLRETGGTAECNIFKSFGLDYVYLENGNSIAELTDVFAKVKNCTKPTVVHIHTNKGNGYTYAQENKEKWHFNAPFDVQSGENTIDMSAPNYNSLTADYLIEKVKQNENIVVINAGTPGAVGFTSQKRALIKNRFIDVGIAEEHAVAMSSAMAKAGCKPIYCVLSSFVQRTYDQLSQDLALNENPAVILVAWTGLGSADATHLGCFDIPLISNIPNLVHLAPTSKEEYFSMLDWAIKQDKNPIVIRIPSILFNAPYPIKTDFDKLNTSSIDVNGSEVALIGVGAFYNLALKVYDMLKSKGINASVINPRFISGLDEKTLENVKQNHQLVVTMEDGILDGGFGQKIAAFYANSDIKVLNYGGKKEFTDRMPIDELYQKNRLFPKLIVEDILDTLK
ncbi:MAG: 1-deoxy-D-xylulose-5-phosphate synthase [Alphaproteobacteria bacterium]|nr:1-deoxy-D-xylulose-5-phosphate synthase [Alphaproteobacteria bacterium]